jgi:hypothetical protein
LEGHDNLAGDEPELNKFIILKKITHILSILSQVQVQFHYNLGITKREIYDKFINLDLSENLSFFAAPLFLGILTKKIIHQWSWTETICVIFFKISSNFF